MSPEESKEYMFAEFKKRYPEDMIIKSFEGKDVIVNYKHFLYKEAKGDVACFIYDGVNSFMIYQGGKWVHRGPSVTADKNRQLGTSEFIAEQIMKKAVFSSETDKMSQILDSFNEDQRISITKFFDRLDDLDKEQYQNKDSISIMMEAEMKNKAQREADFFSKGKKEDLERRNLMTDKEIFEEVLAAKTAKIEELSTLLKHSNDDPRTMLILELISKLIDKL